MLHVADLSVSYGAKRVVHEAGFALQPGTVTALIGPNGTGKSTLLKAVAGLLPFSGSVSLKGAAYSAAEGAIAYMPQDTGGGTSLSVEEVVLLGRLRSLGLTVPAGLKDACRSVLAQFNLVPLAARRLDSLSGGQRQLVFLAQSLFRDPSVLLLDEPTAALDLRHQLIVLDAVRSHSKREGIATVIAIHDLNLSARFADRLICLSDGRIVADGPASEVLSATRIESVYGVRAEVETGADGKQRVTPLAAV